MPARTRGPALEIADAAMRAKQMNAVRWRIWFPPDQFGPGFTFSGMAAREPGQDSAALTLHPFHTGSAWYIPHPSALEFSDYFTGQPVPKPGWLSV